MDPTGTVVEVFAADGIEGETFAPDTGGGPVVDSFNEGTEDARVRVGGARSEEDRVRVPGDRGDGAANGLFEVLAYPPVIFGFEVADGDDAGAGADGEFFFRGRPADEGGGTVDAEEDKSGLPASGGRFPDVGVAVCVVLGV